MLKQNKLKNFITFLILAIFFAAGYFFFNSRKSANNNLQVSSSEIRFNGKIIESRGTLPYLFLEEGLLLGNNAKYIYSEFGEQNQERQFLRIDKLVLESGSYSNRVTAFYLYNSKSREYKRVLQSAKEQNEARYPETEIISQDPLIVRFYYDVSRPLGCYGDGCRSYWADHFRWDSGQEKFVEVNNEFSDFYKDLLKDYEKLNSTGCDLGDLEQKKSDSLEEIFNSSETNYCVDSIGPEVNKREDLNKFFKYKHRVSDLTNSNKSSTGNVLTKHYPLQKGNYWEYEGEKREQIEGGEIVNENVTKKIEVTDILMKPEGTVVKFNDGPDYLIKGNNVFSRESWGNELRFQFPLYVGQKWGNEDSLRYREDDSYVWHVEEKLSRNVLGKQRDECFKLSYKTNSDSSYYVFCYGLGIVEEDYKHNGTILEWNYKLTNYNL